MIKKATTITISDLTLFPFFSPMIKGRAEGVGGGNPNAALVLIQELV